MRHTFASFSLAVALSATGMAAVPADVSWVRVVHASSDAPAVDILANGNLVFQGLRYKGYTEYTPVAPGSYSFSINLTGTTTTAYSTEPLTLQGGNAYSFFAIGKVANRTLTVLGAGDDVDAAGMGMVKLRIVHGASTAPSVDVYATAPYAPLTSAPVLSAVPYLLAGPYLTVPAGVYQARVAVTGTKTVAIDSGRLPLQGNTVRTVVALDPATQGGPFELLMLPDVN
ncbi:MAG: DUF4397 domain-containing protein [Acidobacteria bacterium]|nr:DUF4397 domain-containing protein [Acidobacteriota bacterium]